MARKAATLTSLLWLTGILSAQGLNTTATKDDWEDINFELNSSILSDGYPSMLRLAELLNKHPDHKVKLVGHADSTGTHPYNDKLGMRRAEAVKAFLEKYGARPGQVSVTSNGDRTPKADNANREGRFMNRRVDMTVTDGQGKIVGAGGPNDVIKALEAIQKKQEECCSQILKRLEKLDEILGLLRDLKKDHDDLKREVAALKNAPQTPTSATPGPGGPVTPAEATRIADAAADKAAKSVEDSLKRISKAGPSGPVLSLMGMNVGVDGEGRATFTGRGRLFKPLGEHTAIQGQGEYMYFRDRKEGQFDLGLVNRFKQVQVGAFSSFKAIGLKQMDSTGVVGQAAFTADYLFKHGRIGMFGTKSFLNNAVVAQRRPSRWVLDESYLSVVDQMGGSGAVQVHPRVVLEGNLGWLRRANGDDRPGGTLRFVFPVNKMIALTAEGGFNETLVGRDNNGRAVFGILFGNYLQPREFLNFSGPVPVDIPRVRYEVLTRRTRTGNDPPVADAGADQVGVRAGQLRLDGSGSFDPDGDPIRYQWTQVAGPAVTIANATAAVATFTALEDQSYGFRLTVTDDKNAQGIARVTISTRAGLRTQITRFTATPDRILPGGTANLNYNVVNADSVTISGVTGDLSASNGSVPVSPAQTTNYVLTARNANGSEDRATVTVVVDTPGPRTIRFTATPMTINRGQKSTLSWQTSDAESVEIVGVGTYTGNTGTVDVTPEVTTAYTLIARSRIGQTTSVATVTVVQGNRPTVISFSANPVEIGEGQTSTLAWNVEGANEVTISHNVGKVNPVGSAVVQPSTTTTYTLTAVNDFGQTTAIATVVVYPRPRILSFTVNPTTATPGQPVTFTWETEGADYVFISGGIGNRIASGSLTNAGPTSTQTYTLSAIGKGGVVNATATVTVNPPVTNSATPVARISPADVVTTFRELVLNGTPSFDPNNRPLTYSWRSVDNRGTVVNPTSATPTVQLRTPFTGSFVFELQVTNDAGLSSKALVTVQLIPPRQ
jgi:hypothetical protein